MVFPGTDVTWSNMPTAAFDGPVYRDDDLTRAQAPIAAAPLPEGRLPLWMALSLIVMLALLAWVPVAWFGVVLWSYIS